MKYLVLATALLASSLTAQAQFMNPTPQQWQEEQRQAQFRQEQAQQQQMQQLQQMQEEQRQAQFRQEQAQQQQMQQQQQRRQNHSYNSGSSGMVCAGNVCAASRPDIGGAISRALDQYNENKRKQGY